MLSFQVLFFVYVCVCVCSYVKNAPLSQVISQLSEDLGIGSEEKLLLSHKTATLLPTESPLSRSLTTADIIGTTDLH